MWNRVWYEAAAPVVKVLSLCVHDRYVLGCLVSHQERAAVVFPQTGRDDLWTTTERARGQNPRGVWWDTDNKACRYDFVFQCVENIPSSEWSTLKMINVYSLNRAVRRVCQVHTRSADATVWRAACKLWVDLLLSSACESQDAFYLSTPSFSIYICVCVCKYKCIYDSIMMWCGCHFLVLGCIIVNWWHFQNN